MLLLRLSFKFKRKRCCTRDRPIKRMGRPAFTDLPYSNGGLRHFAELPQPAAVQRFFPFLPPPSVLNRLRTLSNLSERSSIRRLHIAVQNLCDGRRALCSTTRFKRLHRCLRGPACAANARHNEDREEFTRNRAGTRLHAAAHRRARNPPAAARRLKNANGEIAVLEGEALLVFAHLSAVVNVALEVLHGLDASFGNREAGQHRRHHFLLAPDRQRVGHEGLRTVEHRASVKLLFTLFVNHSLSLLRARLFLLRPFSVHDVRLPCIAPIARRFCGAFFESRCQANLHKEVGENAEDNFDAFFRAESLCLPASTRRSKANQRHAHPQNFQESRKLYRFHRK